MFWGDVFVNMNCMDIGVLYMLIDKITINEEMNVEVETIITKEN